MHKCLSEFVGTFALVFVGTGTVVVNDLYGGIVTHVGVGLAFGLVIMVMIYAVGEISGAHFNPAVSIGFWLARRFPDREVMPYLLSQILGALLASTLLWLLFPEHNAYGTTLPAIEVWRAFLLEVVISFFLMFVIINVATGSHEQGIMAGAAIGGTVALAALFAGPATGASMNPARSLAPALVSGNLNHLWLYLTAPLVGAAIAVFCWRLFLEE